MEELGVDEEMDIVFGNFKSIMKFDRPFDDIKRVRNIIKNYQYDENDLVLFRETFVIIKKNEK